MIRLLAMLLAHILLAIPAFAFECLPLSLFEEAGNASHVPILRLIRPIDPHPFQLQEGGIPGQAWSAIPHEILKDANDTLSRRTPIIVWMPGDPAFLPPLHQGNLVFALLAPFPSTKSFPVFSLSSRGCLPPIRNLSLHPWTEREQQDLATLFR
ncbi:MAG: hypothetical protein D6690_14505 [Nitrospirae bacterium]|nr:MAG: hypothetical protein D6690_14505 [Nitrospirota bacterium]